MSYRSSDSYPRGSSSSGSSRSANFSSSSSSNSWASPSRGGAGGGVGAYSAAYDDVRRYAAAPPPAATHHQPYGQNTFPSPATSTTSTASSLRTPPDLLLNGTLMGTAWKAGTLHSSLEKQAPAPAYLSVAEIEKRIKLLSTLPSELMSDALPSPPSSPRPAARKKAARMEEPEREARQGSSSRSAERLDERRTSGARSNSSSLKAPPSASAAARKRKSDVARVDYSDDSETESKPKSRAAGPDKRPRTTSNAGSSRNGRDEDASASRSSSGGGSRSREASSSAVRLDAPEPREWTKERFLEVAASYRTHGRELKHRGDQRLREASAQHLSSGQPSSAALLAALEQTDALLLYVYGFWCEDQAATNGNVPHACVAHNWASIFGLLKYVHACHERNGNRVLAGLCRLLEAVVLRRLSEHEQRLLSHRLQKLAALAATAAAGTGSASAAGSLAAGSVEVTAPSPASAHSADTNAATAAMPAELVSALADAARSMAKSVADSERSNKLFAQARVALSAAVLEAHHPDVWAACLGAPAHMEAWRDASRLDPAAIGTTAREDASAARWAWPLEHVTPLPHFVTFGRALLRDTAASGRLNFRPARVPPPSSTSSRS